MQWHYVKTHARGKVVTATSDDRRRVVITHYRRGRRNAGGDGHSGFVGRASTTWRGRAGGRAGGRPDARDVIDGTTSMTTASQRTRQAGMQLTGKERWDGNIVVSPIGVRRSGLVSCAGLRAMRPWWAHLTSSLSFVRSRVFVRRSFANERTRRHGW